MSRKEVIMNDRTINYSNFQPTPGFEAMAYSMYQEVCSRAPQSSKVSFRFEKQGDIYTAYGTIDTQRGVFVGYSAKPNLTSSLQDMGKQLESRLTLVHRKEFGTQLRKTG
jgi:hypothetical protein